MAQIFRPPSSFQLGTLFGVAVAASVLTVVFWGQADYQPTNGKTDQPRSAYHKQKSGNPISRWWRWTLSGNSSGFYTLGLIGVGSLQAGFFIWQLVLIREGLADTQEAAETAKEQANLARESLEASNRSWIKVIPTITSDLNFNECGAYLNVKLMFKNIGKSPAFNVFCVPRLCPTTNDRKPKDLINTMFSQDPAFIKGAGSGFSIFPDEEIEQNFTVVLSNSDIISGGFGRSTIPGLESEGSATHMALDLYGMVRYSDSFSERWRHTPFIYNILRPDGLGTFPKAGPNVLLSEMCLNASWSAGQILD